MSSTRTEPHEDRPVAGGSPPAAVVVPRTHEQAGAALLVVAGLLAAGVVLGVLWSMVAPTVPCTVVPDDCLYSYEGGRFFIAEGIFAAVTTAAGVLAAIMVRRWVRELGWPVVVALTIGGLLAGVVAWRVGVWLGPDDPVAAGVATGEVAELPIRLRSVGLLFGCPIGALLVTMWIAFWAEDDPAAEHPDGGEPTPDPEELAAWQTQDRARTPTVG